MATKLFSSPAQLIITGSLICAVSFADTTNVYENVVELEKLIVIATRHETRQHNSPSLSYVVSRKEIEDINASKVSDALKYVAGLSVESGTGSGSPYKKNVSVSGMPNYYNVVMVNGMRLRSSHIQTGVNIDLIPAEAIERIEIVKDASSALYGSDALGGVINIVTRKGTALPEALIKGASAIYDTWGGEVAASGSSKSGKAFYSVYAGYERSDGLDIILPAHRIGHLGYRKTSAVNRFDFYPTNKLSLTGYLNFLTDDADFRDGKLTTGDTTLAAPDSSETTWYQVANEYDMMTALMFMPGINVQYDFSDKVTGHFQTYYTHWDAEISTELDELASPKLSFDIRLPNNTITLGAEYLWRNYFRSGLPDTADQHTLSAFVQDQMTLMDTALVALLALRLDYVGNTGANSANNGPVPSPKVSVLYRPVGPLALRFSTGRAFKAPTVQELYEDRFHRSYFRLGNSDLKPEFSTNLALGCKFTPIPWFFLDVNGYVNFIDNMIVAVTEAQQRNGRDVYKRYNIEKGAVSGGDLHTGLRVGSDAFSGSVDVGLGLAFQASKDDSLHTPYQPGTSCSGRLQIRAKMVRDLYLSGFVGYNGVFERQYWSYSSNEINDLDDMHNIEIGLDLDMTRMGSLYFKINNILGREHETYEDALMKIAGDRIMQVGISLRIF